MRSKSSRKPTPLALAIFEPASQLAQGIAYVDFGFIEPALLGAIAKTAKDGQAAPKGLEGHLVTRVAMGVDVLARLHQQIQQVLVGMRDARLPNKKA